MYLRPAGVLLTGCDARSLARLGTSAAPGSGRARRCAGHVLRTSARHRAVRPVVLRSRGGRIRAHPTRSPAPIATRTRQAPIARHDGRGRARAPRPHRRRRLVAHVEHAVAAAPRRRAGAACRRGHRSAPELVALLTSRLSEDSLRVGMPDGRAAPVAQRLGRAAPVAALVAHAANWLPTCVRCCVRTPRRCVCRSARASPWRSTRTTG